MNKQSKKVKLGVALENNRAYLLRTEITRSHFNNRTCQHCGVKTSRMTPSFYYLFNIILPCNINIPSFIGNLWWVFLLGNHLKQPFNLSSFRAIFGPAIFHGSRSDSLKSSVSLSAWRVAEVFSHNLISNKNCLLWTSYSVFGNAWQNPLQNPINWPLRDI